MSYNPYQQSPEAEQGYGYGYDGQAHELQDYGQQQQPVAGQTLPQQEFLGRIDFLRNEIGTLTSNVEGIASLHQRSLAEADSGGAAVQQLERIVAQTQNLNVGIRDQLKFLANDAHRTVDAAAPSRSASSFRARYRDQIARQYRIVNPDASEDEVREAAEADWGNEGVFQTALRTNRTGQASSVLGAVRARHNELQRIEKTLMELASLFQDLAVLVDQQEVPVAEAENNAENTTKYMTQGNEQVKKGIISARNARKWKWWCLLITILIIAVAVGVGVGVTQASKAASGN
ncbi:hypothetical protein CHU98_g9357 [Xylaria longipes]|nr:hypothetical protein CHU98_g9357 [Xylaria longipes]